MSRQKAKRDYLAARVALLTKGFTIRAWAHSLGIPHTTVHAALRGDRHGSRSLLIRRKLEDIIHAV